MTWFQPICEKCLFPLQSWGVLSEIAFLLQICSIMLAYFDRDFFKGTVFRNNLNKHFLLDKISPGYFDHTSEKYSCTSHTQTINQTHIYVCIFNSMPFL